MSASCNTVTQLEMIFREVQILHLMLGCIHAKLQSTECRQKLLVSHLLAMPYEESRAPVCCLDLRAQSLMLHFVVQSWAVAAKLHLHQAWQNGSALKTHPDCQ